MTPSSTPVALYHGTHSRRAGKIAREGLKRGQKPRWPEDSDPHYVYLDESLLSAEAWGRKDRKDVLSAVFWVDVGQLDTKKLEPDPAAPRVRTHWRYRDDIPLSAVQRLAVRETEDSIRLRVVGNCTPAFAIWAASLPPFAPGLRNA